MIAIADTNVKEINRLVMSYKKQKGIQCVALLHLKVNTNYFHRRHSDVNISAGARSSPVGIHDPSGDTPLAAR